MTKIPGAPGDISSLIREQYAVVSAAQAAAHGLAHETLRRRVLRGIWQRLLPGVYLLQCGPPNGTQLSIAALLYAGEGSILTGPAALTEHGLTAQHLAENGLAAQHLAEDGPAEHHLAESHYADNHSAGHQPGGQLSPGHHPAEHGSAQCHSPALHLSTHPEVAAARIHVLVPHRTRRQNTAFVHIVRTTYLPTPTVSGALRVAPLAKAVVDSCLSAAQEGDPARAQALVDAAVGSGRVSIAELEDELGRAPRRHSGGVRRHLSHHRERAREEAKDRLLDALGATGPFGSLPDVAVYAGKHQIARAAALWPTRAVAAAVDAPVHEVETLSSLGFAVVQIAPQQVSQDLAAVLHKVGTALMERPEATMPTGVSLLPRASATRAPASPRRNARAGQRVLTASSPACTGASSVLPRGGTGHT